MIQPKSWIETGSMDRVEILLNPGSFLRVAENSIVRINETKLDNVRIALDKGTVIVESSVFDKKVHALRIETAAGDIAIQKEGLYRFEADPERVTVDVAVRRGKAQWLPEGKPQVTLKADNRFHLPASSAGGELQFAKFSKEQMDNLDNWSMRRAQYLVAASAHLSSRVSDSWYSSYDWRGFRGGWFFDPFFQMFTFIPFGSNYHSPYGFSCGGYNPSPQGNTGSAGSQRPTTDTTSLARSRSLGNVVGNSGGSVRRSRGR
jgi:hypothetical protein